MFKNRIISNFFSDAPEAVYGSEGRQQDILSDGTGIITVYGLIGDKCLDDRDCFIDHTSCLDGTCSCLPGHLPTSSNLTCLVNEQLSLCDPNPCQGGGTCEEHDGTFSCYCPPGLAGSNCQHDVSQASLNVVSFTGHSWIGLDIPNDVVNRFDLELSFRSFSDDGILFFVQGSKDNDFLSLTLREKFVEFKYDLGSGQTLTLRSNVQVRLGHWHRLVAKRYNRDGFLSLDSDKVTGSSVGSIKTLNVDKLGYIGGINPELELDVREKSGLSEGFIGCIKDVQMGRQSIRMESEFEPRVRQRTNVVECTLNPCSRMPCANGGSCQANPHQGYQCKCKANFTGRQCQRERDTCHPNPCQNHGQCVLDDLRGFVCKCKNDFNGRLCQSDISDKRFRKSLDRQDDKEKIQFSLRSSFINSGQMFSVHLEHSNDTLDIGFNDFKEIWIRLFERTLVLPKSLVPNEWQKIVITKQHHKLSLRLGDQHQVLQDEALLKISFDELKLLKFTGKSHLILNIRTFSTL